MNKKRGVLILMLLFLFGCLVGCLGQDGIDNEPDDARGDFVISHYKTWSLDADKKIIHEGFVYNDEDVMFYMINGEVRNQCGYKTSIRVTIYFFDDEDIFLDSAYFVIKDLPDTYYRYFEQYFIVSLLDYGENIDHASFKLEET